MNDEQLLDLVSSTETMSFYELCSALGEDRPEKDDRKAWWELFQALERLEKAGLIEVERDAKSRIDSLILTEAGVSEVREARMR